MASSDKTTQCILCNCNAIPRTYAWDYRPCIGDIAKGQYRDEHATLKVNLCDKCHWINNGMKLEGWNFWDAVDGLKTYDTCLCGSRATTLHNMGGVMCPLCASKYNQGSYY
jgi:hypothetical protein